MFKLIIFDCDGVLVDSEKLTNLLFIELASDFGVKISIEEMISTYVGNPIENCIKELEALNNVIFPKDFLEIFKNKSADLFLNELKSIPGISQVLVDLHLPYCLASNSKLDKITLMLRATNLLTQFEGKLFTSSLVKNPKPAPDIYLHVAKQYDLLPKDCLVVEDSPTGVKAAKSAGMTVFAYSDLFSPSRLRNAGADRVFTNMFDLIDLIQNETC